MAFKRVPQKSHQRLPWRGGIDLHFIYKRFFCTSNVGDARSLNMRISSKLKFYDRAFVPGLGGLRADAADDL